MVTNELEDESIYEKVMEKGKKIVAGITIGATLLAPTTALGFDISRDLDPDFKIEQVKEYFDEDYSYSEMYYELIDRTVYVYNKSEDMDPDEKEQLVEFVYDEIKPRIHSGEPRRIRYIVSSFDSINENHLSSLYEKGVLKRQVRDRKEIEEGTDDTIEKLFLNSLYGVEKSDMPMSPEEMRAEDEEFLSHFENIMDDETYKIFEEEMVYEGLEFINRKDKEIIALEGLVTSMLLDGNESEDYEEFKDKYDPLIEKLGVSDFFDESEKTEFMWDSVLEKMTAPKNLDYFVKFDRDEEIGAYNNFSDLIKGWHRRERSEINDFLSDNHGHRMIMEKLFGEEYSPDPEIDYVSKEVEEAAENYDVKEYYEASHQDPSIVEKNGKYIKHLSLEERVGSGVIGEIDLEKSIKMAYNFSAKSIFMSEHVEKDTEAMEELKSELEQEYMAISRYTGQFFLDQLKYVMFQQIHEDFYDDLSRSEFFDKFDHLREF